MSIIQKYHKTITLEASQTYNYEQWLKVNYENFDLHSITLKGCFLSECNFVQTVLADSDWDSCQVECCRFTNLSLENSDITSTYFEHCTFDNVSFRSASSTDITFKNCNFINCDFNHINLSSSTFNNCCFDKLKLRQSSTNLNQFNYCQFINSKISGNFFYNLFSDSYFENSSITQNLIASNFGFSAENFKELSLDNINFKTMQQSYLNQKDFIGAAIISLNINEQIYDYSICAGMQIIIKQLENDILVRAEEILFFKAIIINLLTQKKISLYTVVCLLNLVEKLKSVGHNIAIKKSEPAFQQIQGMLLEHYHQIIEQLHADLQEIHSINKPINLKITYEEEPTIPICTLLEQLMKSMNISGDYPVRIKTEIGSFIEWIQSYDNILKCLQLLVSVLGLGVNLKKSISTKPKDPAPETVQIAEDTIPQTFHSNVSVNEDQNHTLNSSIVPQMPDFVLNQLNTVSTEQDVYKTINIFVSNGMNVNNNFQGYNNANIKNIEIL